MDRSRVVHLFMNGVFPLIGLPFVFVNPLLFVCCASFIALFVCSLCSHIDTNTSQTMAFIASQNRLFLNIIRYKYRSPSS